MRKAAVKAHFGTDSRRLRGLWCASGNKNIRFLGTCTHPLGMERITISMQNRTVRSTKTDGKNPLSLALMSEKNC